MPAEPKRIDVNLIEASPELQSRDSEPQDRVTEYKEAIEMGSDFPAITVFQDGNGKNWLADGFLRLAAHKLAKVPDILCEVRQGSFKDAKLFAAGANAEHGMRRTAKDKAKAVMMLLSDTKWKDSSDRWVAEKCKVSHTFVAGVRNSNGFDSKKRTAKDGREVNVRKLKSSKRIKAARTAGKANTVDFDWAGHGSRLGNMNRSIDDLCAYYKQPNNPFAEGIRRKLTEIHTDFRELYKMLASKEAPNEDKGGMS